MWCELSSFRDIGFRDFHVLLLLVSYSYFNFMILFVLLDFILNFFGKH